MAEVRIKLYAKEMNELLRGEQGPVFRDLVKKAERVRELAKVYVGKDTHQLERRIVKRFERRGNEVVALVGSDQPYTLVHHEGSRPHVIMPKKAKVLRFTTKTGKVVFARRVNHPGTKANRFLTRALREVVQ